MVVGIVIVLLHMGMDRLIVFYKRDLLMNIIIVVLKILCLSHFQVR